MQKLWISWVLCHFFSDKIYLFILWKRSCNFISFIFFLFHVNLKFILIIYAYRVNNVIYIIFLFLNSHTTHFTYFGDRFHFVLTSRKNYSKINLKKWIWKMDYTWWMRSRLTNILNKYTLLKNMRMWLKNVFSKMYYMYSESHKIYRKSNCVKKWNKKKENG